MKTPRSQVASLLARRSLEAGAQAPRLAGEIAAYLLAEKRTGELDSLLRDMIARRAELGVVEVTAVSAHKLTAAVLADIRAQVKQRYPNATKIIIHERIDREVVGGVRLELIGRQLDQTIQNKLDYFKQLTSQEES